jgi:hypothetical protein
VSEGERGLARLGRWPGFSPWSPRKRSTLLVPGYLALLRARRSWLERLGLQSEAFLRILELKLENDTRGATGQPGRTLTLGLALLLGISWASGLVPGLVAVCVEDLSGFVFMALVSLVQSALLLLFLLGMYETLLVESTDIATIAPLPVSDRTLYAARIAHVAFYVGLVSLCTLFLPLCLGPIRFAWWGVLATVPLVALLTALLCLGGISLSYALLLRILGPGRFQRASLVAQVSATLLLMAGPQVLPRIVDWGPLVDAVRAHPWVAVLLPPAWFGGLFELVRGAHDPLTLVLAALALCVPLLLLATAIQLASRHFLDSLLCGPAAERPTDTRWPRGLQSLLARRLSGTRAERAGWNLALALTRRDRLFVRGVWPALLGMSLMGCVILLPRHASSRHQLPHEYLGFGAYMCGPAFATMMMMLRFSEHSKARWIYAALPIENPGDLARGAAKCLYFGLLLPVQLVFSLIPLALAGPEALPNLVLVWLATGVLAIGATPMLLRELPFSAEHVPGRMQERNIGPALLYCVATLLAAGLHAAASVTWASQLLFGLVLLVLLRVAWKRLDRIRIGPLPAS